ncbi:hypothetical protein [Promicromonospora xylanilytica]
MIVLATVKAYPAMSSKYGESVCVAGLRLDSPEPEWVRLFPVPFRSLPDDTQFDKYQVLALRAQRGTTDRRPESWKPDLGSLRLGATVGTDNGKWRRRWQIVEPLADSTTTCELLKGAREHGQNAPSLGLIRPADISELVVETNPDYKTGSTEQLDVDLFGTERALLEATPFLVHYRYRCAAPTCRGHRQSIVDWESGQLARRNLRTHSLTEAKELQRKRFLDEMCAPGRETLFYVGNQHQHPISFLVLGLFWPPKHSRPAPTLFD